MIDRSGGNFEHHHTVTKGIMGDFADIKVSMASFQRCQHLRQRTAARDDHRLQKLTRKSLQEPAKNTQRRIQSSVKRESLFSKKIISSTRRSNEMNLQELKRVLGDETEDQRVPLKTACRYLTAESNLRSDRWLYSYARKRALDL